MIKLKNIVNEILNEEIPRRVKVYEQRYIELDDVDIPGLCRRGDYITIFPQIVFYVHRNDQGDKFVIVDPKRSEWHEIEVKNQRYNPEDLHPVQVQIISKIVLDYLIKNKTNIEEEIPEYENL